MLASPPFSHLDYLVGLIIFHHKPLLQWYFVASSQQPREIHIIYYPSFQVRTLSTEVNDTGSQWKNTWLWVVLSTGLGLLLLPMNFETKELFVCPNPVLPVQLSSWCLIRVPRRFYDRISVLLAVAVYILWHSSHPSNFWRVFKRFKVRCLEILFS